MAENTDPGGKGSTEPAGSGESNPGDVSLLDGNVPGGEGGEPKGQETTPDDYESVKFPEGAEVDKDFFGDVKSWAKENKVPAETLTKLVAQWGKRAQEAAGRAETEMKAQRAKQVQGWVKELQEDKEFGGKAFKENVAGLTTFLNKVDADKSFRKALKENGVDNWPPLVRFLHKISKAAKDDSVGDTMDLLPPGSEEKPLGELLYGKGN